jgi:hypothetical protein
MERKTIWMKKKKTKKITLYESTMPLKEEPHQLKKLIA